MENNKLINLEEENSRLKDLIIFLRDELDELINSIDTEVDIQDEE